MSKRQNFITAHPWYNGYTSSISTCGDMGQKSRFKSLRESFTHTHTHTHIYIYTIKLS